MSNKVIIETERQIRDVYIANFNQQVLEQLAAQFIADQQGIDLSSQGVRTQFETNVLPDASPKRRVNMRVCIYVDTPVDDEPEAAGEV